jgi:signal transduction histidine kinase
MEAKKIIEKSLQEQNSRLQKLVEQQQKRIKSLEKTVLEQKEEVRHKSDELLLQQERLTEMNTAKDKLFAVIGHDLRNSLSALMSISDSIHQFYDELDEGERISGIQRINKACTEMYKLLEHLLEWARLQNSGARFSPVVFDLYKMSAEMISITDTAFKEKQLKIRQSMECKALVKADPNMIGTVMRNLLNNAIKFSPRGSEIFVQCSTVQEGEDSVFHEVAVEDQGIGMDQEKVDSLFHLGKSSTVPGTENEQGLGLGLIICKDLVEINGGSLKVESKPGKGSRFIFSLPSVISDR